MGARDNSAMEAEALPVLEAEDGGRGGAGTGGGGGAQGGDDLRKAKERLREAIRELHHRDRHHQHGGGGDRDGKDPVDGEEDDGGSGLDKVVGWIRFRFCRGGIGPNGPVLYFGFFSIRLTEPQNRIDQTKFG